MPSDLLLQPPGVSGRRATAASVRTREGARGSPGARARADAAAHELKLQLNHQKPRPSRLTAKNLPKDSGARGLEQRSTIALPHSPEPSPSRERTTKKKGTSYSQAAGDLGSGSTCCSGVKHTSSPLSCRSTC